MKPGDRFFRVLPGRYPCRDSEIRVQLRERVRFGSSVVDQMSGWVGGEERPRRVVARLKEAILARQAYADEVHAVLGDEPA